MNSSLQDFEDPDGQMPLPFPAAMDYARTVMGWAQEPLPPAIRMDEGVMYGEHRLQCFDVYAPAKAHAAPVLVFWHGGGWTNGYRQYVRFMAPTVVAMGMVLVAPSYRLAPEYPLPCALQDALSLLARLQHELPVWGGSPERVFLSGHSAGGLLASMTALNRAGWQQHGLESNMIRACLPLSAILDLHDPKPTPGSLEERVYTMVLRGLDPLQDTVCSPLYWTSGNQVPFDLSMGQHDSARVLRSNQRFHALLTAQKTPVVLTEIAGLDHFQTHLQLRDPSCAWYQRLALKVQTAL